jgi:hypothetical protein
LFIAHVLALRIAAMPRGIEKGMTDRALSARPVIV